MSSILSGAYDVALQQIAATNGPHIMKVVRLTIESKHRLAAFEHRIDQFKDLTSEDKKYLVDSMTEEIANGVAVVCELLNKGFRQDIMPLVDFVTETATQVKNLQ
jgi:hypothetical protein